MTPTAPATVPAIAPWAPGRQQDVEISAQLAMLPYLLDQGRCPNVELLTPVWSGLPNPQAALWAQLNTGLERLKEQARRSGRYTKFEREVLCNLRRELVRLSRRKLGVTPGLQTIVQDLSFLTQPINRLGTDEQAKLLKHGLAIEEARFKPLF